MALLALGFLIAAQLRTEAPRVRYASQERVPLVETARGLQTQQDGLKQRLLDLRAQIQSLESQGQGSAALVQRSRATGFARPGSPRGSSPSRAPASSSSSADSSNAVPPGDNPTDYLVIGPRHPDGRRGALAGRAPRRSRSTASGSRRRRAIIDIGGSVLVNAAYLSPPYQVSAIGPADLFDQVNGSAGFRDFVRMRVEAFGLQVEFAELKDVTIPAYAGTINLRYARPAPGRRRARGS